VKLRLLRCIGGSVAASTFKRPRYFWMVARSGSVADASQRLHLTPQSISGQLGEREASLGVELFHRAGRGLELTEVGPVPA
jgi:LysR family transcriptional activator of nhaA